MGRESTLELFDPVLNPRHYDSPLITRNCPLFTGRPLLLFPQDGHFACSFPGHSGIAESLSQPKHQITMDYTKDDLDKSGAATGKIHKIRITLTSRNVKPLEKCESSSVECF